MGEAGAAPLQEGDVWGHVMGSECSPEAAAEQEDRRSQKAGERLSRGRYLLLLIAVAFVSALAAWLVGSSAGRGGKPQPLEDPFSIESRKQNGGQRAKPQVPAEAPATSSEWVPVGRVTVEELKQEKMEVAQRLVEDFPQDPNAAALMGSICQQLGDTAKAAECWRKCLELDSQRASAYGALGTIAVEKASFEEAAAAFRKALEIRPESPVYPLELAESLTTLGEAEEATEVLQKAAERFPKDSRVQLKLAQVYLGQKDFEKAKQGFETVIALEPDAMIRVRASWLQGETGYRVAQAHFGLATVYARLGDPQKAVEHRKEFKSLHDEWLRSRTAWDAVYDDLRLMRQSAAETHASAGRIYQAHGYAASAASHWERGASLDADNVTCRVELVKLHSSAGRLAEALPPCEELVTIEPTNPVRWLDLGVTYALLNRFDDAETALVRASRWAPRSAAPHVTLAQLYLQTNRKLVEAARLAQAAVDLEPTAANYVLLSAACERSGNRAGALSAMKSAMELDPENPDYPKIYASLEGAK
jgi:tetratricopeptide (TPR) repeat protein